jgi:hypothetical protein
MEPEKLREIKRATEADIRRLLVRFAERTGFAVHGIDVEMIDLSTKTYRKIVCSAVFLDIRL